MNKYLEKVAKEYITQTRVEDDDVGRKVSGAILGGATSGIVIGKLGGILQKPIINSLGRGAQHYSDDFIKKVSDSVLPETNSTLRTAELGAHPNVRELLVTTGEHTGPYYMHKSQGPLVGKAVYAEQASGRLMSKAMAWLGMGKELPAPDKSLLNHPHFQKNFIYSPLSGNQDILLHEMGHARDFSRGNVGLKLKASKLGSIANGTLSAGVGGAMLGSEKTRDYAWMAPIVGSLPTMRSEFMANVHGAKMIAEHGGKIKPFLGLAAKNLLGYAMVPALSAAAIHGINKARKAGEEINPAEYIRDDR